MVRRVGDFEQFEIDICDVDLLRSAVRKARPDAIIHLAARAGVRPSIEQPSLYERVNVAGTVNLLELARELGPGKRIATIIPPMALEEAIETTKIHSIAGALDTRPVDATAWLSESSAVVLGALRVAAEESGWLCGQRLAPFLGELVPALEAEGLLRLEPADREQLLGISAATIDRRLAPFRRQLRPRGLSTTKPGTLPKQAVPIRTWTPWDQQRPAAASTSCAIRSLHPQC
jgi:hypothetical protein